MYRYLLFLLYVAAFTLGVHSAAEDPQPCDSPIYCYGELLKTVQLKRIYNDSKTFVDMKQKYLPNKTLKIFQDMMNKTHGNPETDDIIDFVKNAFDETYEFDPYIPSDWTSKPSILDQIKDRHYKHWAKDLNKIWKNLTKKMGDDIRDHSDQHSLIYVPNAFVIPGGRFKEFYYWDTYWIVQGLLLCDMVQTTRGILENFLYIVNKYGHIPNGGRVYYINRSQPPMLTPMVNSYITKTKDITFLKKYLHLLEKEFEFWMRERTTTVRKDGKEYTLARYYSRSLGPRPESYRQDYEIAERFGTEQEKTEFYIDIKSAAESGWDFSSRWFIYNGTNGGNLSNTHTRHIIPVDLNALIYWNADLLSNFNKMLGNLDKANQYRLKADKFKAAITAVLWNEKRGTWLDYDNLNNKPRDYFYPSNLTPLWTKCYDLAKASYYANRTVEYISHESIHKYLGGIPTSFEMSTEQWDLPNAWPPLQIITIQGLAYTNDRNAIYLAYMLADRWVKANYKGYQNENTMFEKYDAVSLGKNGAGGEYDIQFGFGWTNGVIFELLNTYGYKMKSPKSHLRRFKRRYSRHS